MKSLFLIVSLALSPLSFASTTIIKESQYINIFSQIESIVTNYSPSEVIVVFDIDDTLLHTEDCKLPNGRWANGNQRYVSCPSEHTEEITANKIKELQLKGISVIALTARSNFLIEATQRELARDHNEIEVYDFNVTPFNVTLNSLPIELTKKCSRGQVAPCLKPGQFNTRPSFINGVMYANGAHKGLALKAILKKFGLNKKAIFFVDDKIKNINHVNEVYRNSTTEVTLFHYTKY